MLNNRRVTFKTDSMTKLKLENKCSSSLKNLREKQLGLRIYKTNAEKWRGIMLQWLNKFRD